MNKQERIQQIIKSNPKAGEQIINKLSKLNQIQKDWTDTYKSNIAMYAEEISLELIATETELNKELIKIPERYGNL